MTEGHDGSVKAPSRRRGPRFFHNQQQQWEQPSAIGVYGPEGCWYPQAATPAYFYYPGQGGPGLFSAPGWFCPLPQHGDDTASASSLTQPAAEGGHAAGHALEGGQQEVFHYYDGQEQPTIVYYPAPLPADGSRSTSGNVEGGSGYALVPYAVFPGTWYYPIMSSDTAAAGPHLLEQHAMCEVAAAGSHRTSCSICKISQENESADGGSCNSCSSSGDEGVALQPSGTSACDRAEAGGWGSLTIGILQNIMARLTDSGAVKQARVVCRHWRAAVDNNLEQLTPSIFRSKALAMLFPNLKVLHLTNCSLVRNRDLLNVAAGGLRLHTLTLGDDANAPWVTNRGLAAVAAITTLTTLNLQDCVQVTNQGIASLNSLQRLAALSLKGCAKLSCAGLDALARNTALTSLNLAGCTHISDKGLLPLAQLPNLVCLHLGNTRVRDEGLGYIAQITSLHELHFAKEAITDVGITRLSTLTNLQSLALRECAQVSGDSLSTLVPKLPNLQLLDLFQSYQFDDQQLQKCLQYLESVTFLDLRGTDVTEEGIEQLAHLPHLQKLCLAPKSDVRVEFLCVISHLTQLTSLAINNCRLVSSDLVESLRSLKLLRELDISNSASSSSAARQAVNSEDVESKEPVSTNAMSAMAAISSLTSIDLSRRPVHEEHLNVLAEGLPRLRTLVVVGCPVPPHGVQALQRRFPELVIHRKPLLDTPMSCASSDHGL